MIIRKATVEDISTIAREVEARKMFWHTPEHVRQDVNNSACFIAEENGEILGCTSVVYKPHRGYHAITRGVNFSNRKGVASAIIDAIIALGFEKLGATPWDDNPAAYMVFEKKGFKFQYQFGHYKFYQYNA